MTFRVTIRQRLARDAAFDTEIYVFADYSHAHSMFVRFCNRTGAARPDWRLLGQLQDGQINELSVGDKTSLSQIEMVRMDNID